MFFQISLGQGRTYALCLTSCQADDKESFPSGESLSQSITDIWVGGEVRAKEDAVERFKANKQE